MSIEKKREQKKIDYVTKMKTYRDSYLERKSFISGFVIPPFDELLKAASDESDSSTDMEAGESDYSANGMEWEELAKKSLKGSCGLTADELNSWINPRTKNKKCQNCGKQSHMYNTGADFLEAEKKSGYRADAIAAHAAEESGWGTSRIACQKKNYFGYGAVDSNPMGGAYAWSTHKEGLLGATKLISEGYIYRSQKHKGHKDQDSFWLMNHPPKEQSFHRYASNDDWVKNICIIWGNAPSTENKEAKTYDNNETTQNTSLSDVAESNRILKEETPVTTIDVGKIKNGRFIPPKTSRNGYITLRKNTDHYQTFREYESLPKDIFVHLEGEAQNFYSKETRELVLQIKRRSKKERLFIKNGFNLREETTSNSIGIGMDILTTSLRESLLIADIAFECGCRSIGVAPNFVHVDTGPAHAWKYEGAPVYKGPNTVRLKGEHT